MKNVQILCANNEPSNHQYITYERDLSEIITGMSIHFSSSTKPQRTFKITIWSTTRLKLETDFEDVMNNTLFGLEQENI